jgi:type I restriction enzyme S subunit
LIYSHSFDSTFISYFFRSANFQDQKNRLAKGVKVKDISSTAIAKIRVPVPDIETQRHIASALSQLDDLVSDSPVGLLGEIQARRKQYEYYRNNLLTFKELDAE